MNHRIPDPKPTLSIPDRLRDPFSLSEQLSRVLLLQSHTHAELAPTPTGWKSRYTDDILKHSPEDEPLIHTQYPDQNHTESPGFSSWIPSEPPGSTPAESLPRPQQTSHHDVIPYHCNRHRIQPSYSKSSIRTTTFTSVNQHFPPRGYIPFSALT